MLHSSSWSRCRSLIRSGQWMRARSKNVQIFPRSSDEMSSFKHKSLRRTLARWYTCGEHEPVSGQKHQQEVNRHHVAYLPEKQSQGTGASRSPAFCLGFRGGGNDGGATRGGSHQKLSRDDARGVALLEWDQRNGPLVTHA